MYETAKLHNIESVEINPFWLAGILKDNALG